MKKKHLILNIILAVIGVLLILLGAAYFYVAYHYKTHFLPHTTINSIECDDLTASEVTALLEAQSMIYELTVTGQDGAEIGVLTSSDVGLEAIDVLNGVEAILQEQSWLEWIMPYLGKMQFSYDLLYGMDFDREQTIAQLDKWPALDERNMEQPQDAYISDYLPEKKGYEIIPETRGSVLDTQKVKELVLAAVQAGEVCLDLEETDCYIRAAITSDNEELAEKCERLNLLTGTVITYDWNGTEVVLDGDTIHEWIVENDGEITVDQEAVAGFVAEQAKEYDTYGKSHRFTTTLGETITVANGGYGWKTDRATEAEELLALIEEGAVTEREPVYRSKGAKKGADDVGTSYVEIDLTNQHLYLYQNGKLVLETDFVSGNMSKGYVTPGGLYALTYKTKNAVLRGDDYETPVNYWMPFNGNIGMHDATWRANFGGDIYLTNGSHGCINLPLSAAKEIYEYVSTGFPVICYYY